MPRSPGRPRVHTAPAAAPDPPPQSLLVPRRVACEMLAISSATAIRLEACGKLTAIKLHPNPNGKTFYKRSQVLRLAQEGDDA